MLPFIVANHGPTQLFRAATVPICDARQFRAADGPDRTSARSPLLIAVSRALTGSKTNARSFELPSPLTSPRTVGVKVKPDDARSAVAKPTAPPKKSRETCAEN